MNVTSFCSTKDFVEYQSEYDETYILILRSTESLASQTSRILFSSTCFTGNCSQNHYLNEFGECQQCPEGSTAPIGVESETDCIPCSADGMVVEHPKSSNCIATQIFVPFKLPATEWRLFTLASFTRSGWVWDVTEITFFSSNTCSPSTIIGTNDGAAFDSGNAGEGWIPENAFDGGDSTWGGRANERNQFWIGWNFSSNVTVRCVVLNQQANLANNLWVQAKQQGSFEWKNVAFISDLVEGENSIVVQA
jgi:hypothetical protein